METDEKCLPAEVHAREVIEAAGARLKALIAQRLELTREIETAKRTINALAAMFGKELLSGELLLLVGKHPIARARGLTAACREILLESGKPLRATEVADRIPELLRNHKEPVASVTTILNRLVEYGEVATETIDGRRMWASVARDVAETSHEKQ